MSNAQENSEISDNKHTNENIFKDSSVDQDKLKQSLEYSSLHTFPLSSYKDYSSLPEYYPVIYGNSTSFNTDNVYFSEPWRFPIYDKMYKKILLGYKHNNTLHKIVLPTPPGTSFFSNGIKATFNKDDIKTGKSLHYFLLPQDNAPFNSTYKDHLDYLLFFETMSTLCSKYLQSIPISSLGKLRIASIESLLKLDPLYYKNGKHEDPTISNPQIFIRLTNKSKIFDQNHDTITYANSSYVSPTIIFESIIFNGSKFYLNLMVDDCIVIKRK